MCGITGFWQSNPLDDKAPGVLEEMAKVLYHRGPDGFGYHVDSQSGIGMGHARLSIIDLDTGTQPLFDKGKNLALTVNGEFYDYKKIRTNLKLDGFNFTTKSDSEIALPLYRKHGLSFTEYLRGEFAFTLFDKEQNTLIMVRDRFGIKPLFYHIRDNNIYWGSEIKSLFVHPQVPREFSSEGVVHQLMQTMVPGTTAYKNIHALKPGHMLVVKRQGNSLDVKEHCYWDMEFPREGERDAKMKPENYREMVKEKLSESVAHRLEADVPVGCYLSGGIDSCSMLGIASSIQQSPVKAFTISFDDKKYDEAHIAREMAMKVQADQEQISLAAPDLYGQNYLQTLWHAERTFYNTLGVAKFLMSKRVNECNYRVVVTGEGADELFGGYPAFKRDMLLHGLKGANAEETKAHRELMDKSNSLFNGAILSEEKMSHPEFEKLCGFTPSWIQPWMLTLKMALPLLHPDIRKEIGGYDPIAAIAQSFDSEMLKGRHALDKAQYTWSKTMLECQILNWGGDRVDMANSMESRPAFLDHVFAESVLQIPPHLRIKGNTEKYILREAMKNILPEVLYKREKFAFMAPPAHTDKKKNVAVESLLDELLNETAIESAGIFDKHAIKKFLTEYRHDTDRTSLNRKDALLNHMIGLQGLHQMFIDGRGPGFNAAPPYARALSVSI